MKVLIADVYIKKKKPMVRMIQALSVKLLLCLHHFLNYWNLYVSEFGFTLLGHGKIHLCKFGLIHSFHLVFV